VLNTIALALPSQLVDTTSQDWLDTPIGVGGFAFNQAAIAIRGITVNSMKDLGDAFALSIH
jgi:hypothetical protein